MRQCPALRWPAPNARNNHHTRRALRHWPHAGITTDGPGAGNRTACARVLPGYGVQAMSNVKDPALEVTVVTQSGSEGLPNATMCELAFYSYGGNCVNCPRGTVTTVKGAKSVEECVVPPGYRLPADGSAMASCANGTFREGWAMFSSPAAQNCTPCGDGISSEPRDVDVHPLAANGTFVRATSASCCEWCNRLCVAFLLRAWHKECMQLCWKLQCVAPPLRHTPNCTVGPA